MNLAQKIEAILFCKGEPVPLTRLAKLMGVSVAEVEQGLLELEKNLTSRGIVLIRSGEEVALGTQGEVSSLIEEVARMDLARDIGKAGLEVLTIILYLGPVARSRIDFIRGVSSAFTVRNLLIRGLVERRENPNDRRSLVYHPTLELLAHLGIKKLQDLPEYTDVRAELEKKEAAAQAEQPAEQ